jgi:NAD(P)-dependent dehydrogenase (short-subunit alcohol dehydrogenase family)
MVESTFRLHDKTVLLTGAGTNLGRAIAQMLAGYGANVALVGNNSRELQRLAEDIMNQREIKESAGRAAAIEAAPNQHAQLQDAVAKAAELFGGIDIYIDNSMTERPLNFQKDFSLTRLDELIDINLRSVMVMTHKVTQFLKARKKGRILYMIQDMHRTGHEGDSISAVTRTGLIHFAKCLAHELQPENITVNCLAVPPTEEYLLQKAPKASSLQAAFDEVLKSGKPFRMIESADLAQTIGFLVSPLSSTISGQTLSASGGITTLS